MNDAAAKDKLIAGQAERIAAQADALSRVRAIRQKVAALVIELDLMLAPPAAYPLASVPITYGDPVPDYSRPPSLTPPAAVQMPGQMGAPDGLPMGDPAPESLVEEDLRIRQQEQQAHN